MIERLALVAVIVGLAGLAGRWWQARSGRVHATGVTASGVVDAVLFTTPTCRTCPQVRANLAVVAAAHPGFRWTETDVAADLDRARAHRVLRAPTVVLTDAQGHEIARAAGLVDARDIAVAANLDPTAVSTAA